jgi:hypothetical protein
MQGSLPMKVQSKLNEKFYLTTTQLKSGLTAPLMQLVTANKDRLSQASQPRAS